MINSDSLFHLSVIADNEAYDENMQLVSHYVEIGMIFAKRAAKMGKNFSFVFVPYSLRNEAEEELEKRGFVVSPYGCNLYGEKISNNGYFIQW